MEDSRDLLIDLESSTVREIEIVREWARGMLQNWDRERKCKREREKKRLQEWHHSARLRERARETKRKWESARLRERARESERDERHPETARMREREIDWEKVRECQIERESERANERQVLDEDWFLKKDRKDRKKEIFEETQESRMLRKKPTFLFLSQLETRTRVKEKEKWIKLNFIHLFSR